jgi:cob(I)alamin adenosyltransferase
LTRGFIQVYTGDGKGKTTAAIGLAIRAAGAGKKVFLGQFMKGKTYSEIAALKRFSDLITVEQYGLGRFIRGKPESKDIEAAHKGLAQAAKAIGSGDYDVVILDEANIAVWYGLFTVEELLETIGLSKGRVEIVVTGRKADPKLIERADLVTEMREIKHYFTDGVQAREVSSPSQADPAGCRALTSPAGRGYSDGSRRIPWPNRSRAPKPSRTY